MSGAKIDPEQKDRSLYLWKKDRGRLAIDRGKKGSIERKDGFRREISSGEREGLI